MKRFATYLKLWFALLQNSFVRALEYKVSFVGRLLVEIAWVLTQVIFFVAVFRQIPLLRSWTYDEILFFCGSTFVVDGLYMMILHDNMNGFGRLMRMGLFDFYLLRPVHSLFLGAFRAVNVVSLFNLAAGLGIAIYALTRGSIPFSPVDALTWIFYLGLGAATVIMFGVAVMSLGFWTVQTQPLVWFFFECYRLSFRPDDLYSTWLRRILLSVFPAAFFISIPVRLALHKINHPLWYVAPFVAVGLMSALALRLWQAGVKKYEGALS